LVTTPSLTLKLRQKDSRDPRKLQDHLRLCNSLVLRADSASAAETLEPGARFIVEPLADAVRPRLVVLDMFEIAKERRRAQLAHFLTGGAAHRRVGGDETDSLALTIFRREPLEQRICVGRVPDGERPELGVGAGTVEDDDAPRPANGHEVRQPVDELPRVGEPARV